MGSRGRRKQLPTLDLLHLFGIGRLKVAHIPEMIGQQQGRAHADLRNVECREKAGQGLLDGGLPPWDDVAAGAKLARRAFGS